MYLLDLLGVHFYCLINCCVVFYGFCGVCSVIVNLLNTGYKVIVLNCVSNQVFCPRFVFLRV